MATFVGWRSVMASAEEVLVNAVRVSPWPGYSHCGKGSSVGRMKCDVHAPVTGIPWIIPRRKSVHDSTRDRRTTSGNQ
jgi:hypothetical protein